jgi:tetratricopeptide (TPR) repeat protein
MASDMRRRAALVLVLMCAVRDVNAQCADGTLANKGQCGGPPIVRTVDPNRVAILPFRATGDPALTHIGKGLADLLAAEFNGEVGPVAVEAAEAYRAWERAGGERRPLTQSQALDVARSVGAGKLLLASVVGSARRFTVSATMLHVPDGAASVPQVRIDGTEDSLSLLTTNLATQLRGRAAGITAVVSNDAIRAYFSGMAAYHRSDPSFAEAQFLRAAKLDSAFVLPAYRLIILRMLLGPSEGVAAFRPSFQHLWNHRSTLNAEQRVLLEALADSDDVRFRAQALHQLERVIELLPNSAEAWDIIGDLYFHVGALIGRENWADLSRRAFLRGMRLDAKLCLCATEHLAHFAYLERDTKTFEKFAPDLPWQRYLGAVLAGNAKNVRATRIPYARELAVEIAGPSLLNGSQPEWLTGILLKQQEVDSVLVLLQALANSRQQRTSLAEWSATASHFAGRPSRAVEFMRQATSDSVAYYSKLLEYAYDDSLATERLVALLKKTDADYARRKCDVALSRLRRGDATVASEFLAEIDPHERSLNAVVAGLPARAAALPMICAQVVRGVLASRQTAGGALLHRADSLMRSMPRNCCDRWNYDLALAFARRGEFASAATAVRRHAVAIGPWHLPRLVIGLREEGRWAAFAGDTAAAIKAYRQYLLYRENPEPVLIPQRDSVRSELDILERATHRRRVESSSDSVSRYVANLQAPPSDGKLGSTRLPPVAAPSSSHPSGSHAHHSPSRRRYDRTIRGVAKGSGGAARANGHAHRPRPLAHAVGESRSSVGTAVART